MTDPVAATMDLSADPASPPAAPCTLGELADGEVGRVLAIETDTPLTHRLFEMGILPGTLVEVVRRAPLGDPIQLRLRGYSLSLRRAEADLVDVERAEPGAELPHAARAPEPVRAPLGDREAASAEEPRVLLLGNPNVGKTTLFNALTGSRLSVGNYPGVTVERTAGRLELPGGEAAEVVDLPGTYSLTARSPEEQVAVDALLGRFDRPPDAAVVVLDATVLERTLYLARQVLETGIPVVLALNLMDEAGGEGLRIDVERLSALMGAEVVPTVAVRGEGSAELQAAVERALAQEPAAAPGNLVLSEATQEDVLRVEEVLEDDADVGEVPARRRAYALWALLSVGSGELRIPEALRRRVLEVRDAALEAGRRPVREIVEARYRHLHAVLGEVLERPETAYRVWTERLDQLLTHKVLGSLAFVLVMGVLFEALFAWSDPLIGMIEGAIAALQGVVMGSMGEGPLRGLLAEGVVAGVGNVLVFVPQIALLFLFLGFLEDSGYLARVAFVIDRLMGGVGLHGKAFVPMLSGFACAIPAVMATRAIESRKDRLLTMLVVPLMSCSARLPVYVLVCAVVFPGGGHVLGVMSHGAAALLSMYLLSVAATLAAAAVLRRTVLHAPRPALVLELPPYRMPRPRQLLRSTWLRLKAFLEDAGTIILAMTIVMWALLSYPKDPAVEARFAARRAEVTESLEGPARDAALAELAGAEAQKQLVHSYAGQLGKTIEPVIRPLGFDWRLGIGILGAFAAREVFVSTMGTVFGIQEADEASEPLRTHLKEATWPDGSPLMTPLAGVSLMVFFVLACQCMSTVAVVKRESGSWRWTLFMVAYMTVLAYVGSLLVYQVGSALGWGP